MTSYRLFCYLRWAGLTMSVISLVRGQVPNDIQTLPGVDVCFLPKVVGPCAALRRRYYFSTETCKCEPFMYSMCGGNDNNFLTLEDCRKQCGSLYLKNTCKQKDHVCLKRPVQRGMSICYQVLPRYYYNAEKCFCEKFTYSDCRGTENNFLTLEACRKQCNDFVCNADHVCRLPIMSGGPSVTCTAFIPAYGFNMKTCQCEEFMYGGCGGNTNRFPNKALCNEVCGNLECTPMCRLPADRGSCRALMPMYFYNSATCTCQRFNYGGCGGNANRFTSLTECVNTCAGTSTCGGLKYTAMCSWAAKPGPCKAGYLRRYYFDGLTCKCKRVRYTSCNGDENNFRTRRQCKRSCKGFQCPVCNLPAVSGPCYGSFPKYFFNIKTCQCEKFIYGGCGGNGNRYNTQAECEAVCGSIQCPVCSLPPTAGSCNAKLVRWYFDASECVCKSFIYGGCGGNLNRFHTEADCEASCGSFACPVCKLPQKVGSCKAGISRWFYDISSGKCSKFSWGGCQPNGNNFKKKSDCLKVCDGFVCRQPKKAGPCEAMLKRYYFDATEKMCKEFYWGGCEANGNNFETLKACNKICG